MTSKVALITAPRIAERWSDDETPALIDALHDAKCDVEAVAWYDDVEWSSYALVVLRSPWDWYWHYEDFCVWLSAVGKRAMVLNPPSVVLWNTDKHYLRDLAVADIAVTPTTFVEVGERPSFPDTEFVVKPVISGGALSTARYRPPDVVKATAHVDQIHARGLTVMVQPYLPSVDHDGEKALVFFNQSFDHAIRKQAVLKPGASPDSQRDSHPAPTPYEPTSAELALATDALNAVPGASDLLYARVDLATGAAGEPVLMELELIDPVLFLGYSGGSPHRYAEAITNYLKRT